MKTLHHSLWAFMLLVLPLLACKCDKEDIVKANQFEVKVRVTGENLAGLGAEIKVESRRNVVNPTPDPGCRLPTLLR